MSSIAISSLDDPGPPVAATICGDRELANRRLERVIWAFVGLGVLLRIGRYAMDYPLWWDEAFVAVNLIRRDYLALLRPLDYGQVCPALFLWAELTVVKLLGFSEWTLRLFPLVCAILSVVLFRRMAGSVVRGVPLLLAVAIFAVAYHPIRHAADVKPYASDLLVALALLTLAFEWWREPQRDGRLWALAAVAPIAIALSHPAVFVAGGIMLGLLPSVVRARRRAVWIAFAAFGLSTVGVFVGLYFAFTRAQSNATLAGMQAQWVAAFPPLGDPVKLAGWLATVHTGSMFAYPCGGERGGSILTLLLFAVGAGALWIGRRKGILLICLAPFGLTLIAAAMKRYPYGGVAHGSPGAGDAVSGAEHLPAGGRGVATLLGSFRGPRLRRWGLPGALLGLAAVGVLPLVAEAGHPYRAIHAQKAREFAREFWPEFDRGAEPLCLRWDLGLGAWDSTNLNVAVYLCNQMIYAPHRQQRCAPRWQDVSEDRPLRCVVSLQDPAESAVAGWLAAMKRSYRLSGCRSVVVDMGGTDAKPRTEQYSVYEFVPMRTATGDRDEGEAPPDSRPTAIR